MGRFKGNDATRGLQGDVGDFFNYRQRLGRTVTTRQVGKKGPATNPDQKRIVRKFKKATKYAKAVIKNPERKEVYNAKVEPGKGVYLLAVTDYLKPPVIDLIETDGYTGEAGSMIIVHAFDDFEVKKVTVAIYTEAGNLLEEGEAILDSENDVDYVYVATVDNPVLAGTKIKATAYDLPKNKGTLEITL